MEWVLRSPQIHSTFSNLGHMQGDRYIVNDNCNVALETILHNILTEDKYLRTYRRSISFGQNIKKDLIPLMIYAKEDKTIELLVRILVNVTIPIECLLSVDDISKTDFGRHTIFEINNLLASTKVAFTDQRATKVIIDFLKKNTEMDQHMKLSRGQCTNISNCLLLLRNILHIPEDTGISCGLSPNHSGSTHSVQNQILWNIFSQSLDKIIIKLMTIPEACDWGVTMVQVVALLYKDQHVVTLHKYLNNWLEASLSESSEDNESNTSPPVRRSEDSSPMLTSDPTSDSSDTEGSGKSNDEQNIGKNDWGIASGIDSGGSSIVVEESIGEQNQYCDEMIGNDMKLDNIKPISENMDIPNGEVKKTIISESSDCGYGTQIENQESVSTSSSESNAKETMHKKQKLHNSLHRIINKPRTVTTLQERKRKKIVKRGKANIINVQGLSHKTPTDDDICNVLKEFTVDFLLKGYNSLVHTLHNELLTNLDLEIDTSHFFWLLTYFLKFATQIELDLEHVCSILSFEIVSFLTSEGVNLCEQFDLAVKFGKDLKPTIRRLHLVVTAIREFIQAAEVYKKLTHINQKDQDILKRLQIKMCETEDLRSLLLLLLRHYNPKYHSIQYLQDVIVTNHILLMFMDNGMNLPEYEGPSSLADHMKQFASTDVMYRYGLLLEDYPSNGEFVNDCIFNIMHHVSGDLGCVTSLFHPKILKVFTSIWKSEFELCDDWSDLIEYVINAFVKKPDTLQGKGNLCLETDNIDDDKLFVKPAVPVDPDDFDVKMTSVKSVASDTPKERWTEEEISSLSWKFLQCSTSEDYVSELIQLFSKDGITKSRDSIIMELFNQAMITRDEYEKLSKGSNEGICVSSQMSKEARDEEINKLCEQLKQDGKLKFLMWVQKVLLDTCFAKIFLEKIKSRNSRFNSMVNDKGNNIMNFEFFKDTSDIPVLSPVSYHALLLNKSIPLVPWNCEQATICKDLKFLQMLNKLGFQMPVDTGRVFILIPHYWNADILYEVAGKIAPIDTTKLKFSINDISDSGVTNSTQQDHFTLLTDLNQDVTMLPAPENVVRLHNLNSASMVNFVPMPCTSFSGANGDANIQNWLDVVQKSQDYKIAVNLESMYESASVASDLTHMYVSDEDEKAEELVRPRSDVDPKRKQSHNLH